MSIDKIEKELEKYLPKVLVKIRSSYIAWCSNCKLELSIELIEHNQERIGEVSPKIDNIAKYLQY